MFGTGFQMQNTLFYIGLQNYTCSSTASSLLTILLNTKLNICPLYAYQVIGGVLRAIYSELWG